MITISIEDHGVASYVYGLSEKIESSVLKRMWIIVIKLQSKIRSEKLHGQVLHHRTGNLSRETLTQPDPFVAGDNIVGTIGTSSTARYGKVHEYGGTYDIPEHMSMSRLGKKFVVKAHQATFPERSYLRSALAESDAYIQSQMEIAVAQAVGQ